MQVSNMQTLYIKKQGEPEIAITANHQFAFLNLVNGTPKPKMNTYTPTGIDGQIQQGAITYDATTVQADFLINARNAYELDLLEHKIYDLFSSRTVMRLRSSVSPALVVYCYPQPFTMTRVDYAEKSFSVTFNNLSGFRQSIVNSDEIFKFNGNYQIGLNLPRDKDYSYHFKSNDFNVYNPSDVDIQPLEQRHDLVIKITGTGNNVVLTNTTSNETFTYKKGLTDGQTLTINGINPFLDDTSCGIDTDHGTISLVKGNNHFTVSGLDNPDITFSFPFLYF